MNEDVSCGRCLGSADLPFVVSLLTDFVSVKRSIFDFSQMKGGESEAVT